MNEVTEARKRVRLKRYLAKNNVAFDVDEPTNVLAHRAKVHCYLLRNQPESLHLLKELTGEQVENLAKGNHYVNCLVNMKIMFGLQSGIGCVTPTETSACATTYCRTVADLVKIGWVGPEWLYLDAHMHKLNLIKYN